MIGCVDGDVCAVDGDEAFVVACDGDGVAVVRYVDGAVVSDLTVDVGAEVGVVVFAGNEDEGEEKKPQKAASPPALPRREGAGARKSLNTGVCDLMY